MNPLFTLITVFAVFIPALMLPGPDFVAVVRSSMAHGAAAGLRTTIGVSIGLGMYATISMIGLSALLVEYQWLTWTVRVLGGAYLIYLGIRLILTKPSEINVGDGPAPREARRPLLFGFLVTLTNPKAVVLFGSVFATAVTPATPPWLLVLIIGLVVACALAWYALVSLFMSSSPVVRRFERAKHWIERTAGGCFIVLGGKVMADARNPITP